MKRKDSLREILAAVKAGRISEEEAVKELQAEGVDDLRFANIDYARENDAAFPKSSMARERPQKKSLPSWKRS